MKTNIITFSDIMNHPNVSLSPKDYNLCDGCNPAVNRKCRMCGPPDEYTTVDNIDLDEIGDYFNPLTGHFE